MKKIILIIICFLLCGCYNYNELNKLSIVSSVSIDKKDNKYLVGAQIMNIKNNESDEGSKIIVYEEEGKTINDALRKINNKSSRKLYAGHFSKLVISEEIAKENIVDILDLFLRKAEIKDEFTITVVKNIEASKLIKIVTLPDQIPADFVKNSIETSNIETALTNSSKLDEFMSYYLKKGIDPVITTIKVNKYKKDADTTKNTLTSNPSTYIELNNIGITYKGKLEKYLNQDETIGYNIIRNRISNMIIPVKCNNKYSSILINKSKTKRKVIKNKDKYIININVNSSGIITESSCNNIKELEKNTKKEINKYINKVLNVKAKSKFLGFERDIYLKYPKEKNYNYEVKVKTNFKVTSKGELYEKK